MMTYFGVIISLAVLASCGVLAAIPSYIHVCKRDDPKIDDCIIKSIEDLRPYLVKGIPELDVPSIEPLHLPEVVISKQTGFHAVGTDVTVQGASNFNIEHLKTNIPKNEYQFKVSFPLLEFNALYDLNAKILSLNLKGKGPIVANATDVEGDGILKGKVVSKDGKEIVIFDTLDLKLKLKNYNIRLDNLFNGDKKLGDAVNVALNENKKELMRLLLPRAEETVSRVLLSIANKVVAHFDYNEIFPAK